MEVRVEAENELLPDLSYIAVRIGEVQKQTLYDPKKVYRFPEARRFGKIDVYQRMGTCDLVWSTEQPEVRVCKIVSSEGDTGARLKVHIARPSATARTDIAPGVANAGDSQTDSPVKASPALAKGKETSAAAKRYLQEHDVEGILTGAMRALLKSMPEDAPGFLCNYITSRYAAKQDKPASAPPKPQAPLSVSVQPVPIISASPTFGAYYGKHVLPHKWHSFLPAFHERCAWPRPERKPQTASALEPKLEFKFKPSVASWTSPSLNNTLSRRMVYQKPDVESLRLQAREVMIKASLNGSLDEALRESLGVQGRPVKADLESLRLMARDCLLSANAEGKLTQALTEARPNIPQDMDELRRQTREVVMKANAEGTLAEALAATLSSRGSQPMDSEALRVKACDTLLNALQDGSLGNVLAESVAAAKNTKSQPPVDMEELKAKARAIMIEGNRDGSLKVALQGVTTQKARGPDYINQLRLQASEVLVLASQDGTLAKVLSQDGIRELEELWNLAHASLLEGVKSGSLAAALEATYGGRGQNVDQLRLQVGELLAKASQDGALSKVLAQTEADELTNLRKQAYSTLMQAVADNSLTVVLGQVRPAKEIDQLEIEQLQQLRQKACKILVEAAETDSLAMALQTARKERMEPTAGDIEVLRQQVCSRLATSSQNGMLTRVAKSFARETESGRLANVKAIVPFSKYHTANFQSVVANLGLYGKFHSKPVGVQKPVVATQIKTVALPPTEAAVPRPMGATPIKASMDDMKELRLRVSGLFGEAYKDGSLEKALKDLWVQPEDMLRLRMQARAALSKAEEDGALRSAVFASALTTERKGIETLRREACDAVSKAVKDGSLQRVLAPQQARDVADLRIRACDVFLNACIDGTLQRALTEVAQEKNSSQNERRLPGATPQVKIAFTNAPSVGTWMNRSRPLKPKPVSQTPWLKKPSVGTWLQLRSPEEKHLNSLRDQAREVFITACQNGTLSTVLKSIPAAS